METNKKIILVIIFIVFVLSGFIFIKSRLQKIPSFPAEKITPTITLFPTWVPKPSVKKPTITYEKFPFKPSDKIRKVEIVGCVVDNSEWGMSYPKKVVEIPNTQMVATETMKAFLSESVKSGWGGFPTSGETKSYFGQAGQVVLKKLTIDKFGTARVYFSKEVKVYGGGSGRITCMHDSVELTLKQFPSIKDVVLCTEDTCADQKGADIFKP